jgi:heterotetrameric sarcosine oxidase beta subunit
LKRQTDILIVGGGVIGLIIAHFASRAGLGKITLIEKDTLGKGASSRNLGGVREQFSIAPTINMMRFSVDAWEKLPKELEWNILYDQRGYLMLARAEEQFQQLKRNVSLQNSLGVNSRILSPSEAAKMAPFVPEEGLMGASFNQRDGTVHHDAVLWALERSARRNGVEILEHVECTKILTASGKATGVETSAGEIDASKVVVAAGVFSKDLCQPVGVELPIMSFRREVVVCEPYKSFVRPVVWDLMTGLFLVQTLRGEVLCDTRDPDPNQSRETEATAAFLKKLATEIVQVFPKLGGLHVLRHWAGLYDVTKDGSPILGTLDELENLYPAAGFSGHGMMLSAAVGKLYAELLATGKVPALLEPFGLRRFKQDKLLLEPLIGGRKIA